jgi:O-6-methylguanine DNA methyltransferase
MDAYTRYLRGNPQPLARLPMGEGTRFQCTVWGACREIPAGETRTYGWIARELRLSQAHCRAIGNALRVNPLPILVPCHRVIRASGETGQFRWGAEVKAQMLAWEASELAVSHAAR